MIAILDYGAGNLRSVANALEEIGSPYQVLTSPEGLDCHQKIILLEAEADAFEAV